MSDLGDMGEFGLIQKLTSTLSGDKSLVCGPGDDCAVVQLGNTRLLLSCDAMVQNIHFRSDWATPASIGWKAAAAALSDIAAMGGIARWMLVTLGCSSDTDPAYLEQIYRGIDELTARYGVVVVGGDTVHAPGGILLDVAVVGEMEVGSEPKYRSGAKPGDVVFVTGYPGASALGMVGLKMIDDNTPDMLIEAHTRPQPKLAEGAWLARELAVHAMMDVSDGLVADLGHIAERSGVSIAIETELLSIPLEMRRYAESIKAKPELYALGGGEDYELVFTVSGEAADDLHQRFTNTFTLPLARIGVVQSDAPGVWVDGRLSPPQGYDHFACGK